MAFQRSPNYDELAATYDRRFQDGEDRGVGLALQRLAASIQAESVLEVGCGTGHWLAGLAEAFSETVFYGLDLSTGMLKQARLKAYMVPRPVSRPVPRPVSRLQLVRGRAEAIPFQSEQFDLVYSVNAIHHFTDGRTFVNAARRALRPAGALAVIGLDPRRQDNRWYVYEYFDGTRATDIDRFPTWGTVLDWMLEAGFQRAEWKPVEMIQASTTGREVLSDPFLEKSACSQLALLSGSAYQEGLEKMRKAVEDAEQAGKTLVFENIVYLDMLVGWI